MSNEVRVACSESGLRIPESPGELAAVIYNSLAACYRDTVTALEGQTGITYPAIHIVGGGSSARYLNRLTARYTGKTVFAGPAESTAIGNILGQMLAAGVFKDLESARKCVISSVRPEIFDPE
jgi:rhamnulokinase